VVRKWNVIVRKGILFLFSVSWHHSTLLQTHWASVSLKSCPVWFVFVYVLTSCVFVTRDTVRHQRRFVFGKFVRKPNCSWSEAFVNRGLTVFVLSRGRRKDGQRGKLTRHVAWIMVRMHKEVPPRPNRHSWRLFFYQLDAQNLYFNKFIILLYMFRALLCSSSGGQLC